MARFAPALSIAMFVAAAMPINSASAAVDEVAQGRDIAQRLCAGCHMRPGQGEKGDHSQIPSFRAVANRPGQSLEGTASWLKIAPPTMPNHHLSSEERAHLAAFIMSLREGER